MDGINSIDDGVRRIYGEAPWQIAKRAA